MNTDKQWHDNYNEDEGWYVDPNNPNREIKVEICEDGDTLYGSRPREDRVERVR